MIGRFGTRREEFMDRQKLLDVQFWAKSELDRSARLWRTIDEILNA